MKKSWKKRKIRKICGTCRYYESTTDETEGVCYGDVPAVVQSDRGYPITAEREVLYTRRYCRHYRRR